MVATPQEPSPSPQMNTQPSPICVQTSRFEEEDTTPFETFNPSNEKLPSNNSSSNSFHEAPEEVWDPEPEETPDQPGKLSDLVSKAPKEGIFGQTEESMDVEIPATETISETYSNSEDMEPDQNKG